MKFLLKKHKAYLRCMPEQLSFITLKSTFSLIFKKCFLIASLRTSITCNERATASNIHTLIKVIAPFSKDKYPSTNKIDTAIEWDKTVVVATNKQNHILPYCYFNDSLRTNHNGSDSDTKKMKTSA